MCIRDRDGASLWLPSKDIWNDEPEDGIVMKIICLLYTSRCV